MARRGFIVVGIDHPYGSVRTIFPDGRIIPTALDQFMDYSSDEKVDTCLCIVENQLRIRTADVRFVLDELDRLDAKDPLGFWTGRIDTSCVGVFGHSFGGAVAAEVCNSDRRFRAGINFDGLLFGNSLKKGVATSFMFVSDDSPIPTADDLAKATGSRKRHWELLDVNVQAIRGSLSKYGGYWLTVRGANHSNFSDSPLYTPIKRIVGAGPVDGRQAMSIVNEYTKAFFQKHLLEQDNGFLDNTWSRTDDVYFEAWPIRPDATSQEKP